MLRARRVTRQGMRMTLWMKRRNSMPRYSFRSRFRCIIMANHDLMFHAACRVMPRRSTR